MTYYPVNSMLVSLPNTSSTTSHAHSHASSAGGGLPGHAPSTLGGGIGQSALPNLPPPPPPVGIGSAATLSGSSNNSKTLSLHGGQHHPYNPRASDFQAFGTVHRSQKIYL